MHRTLYLLPLLLIALMAPTSAFSKHGHGHHGGHDHGGYAICRHPAHRGHGRVFHEPHRHHYPAHAHHRYPWYRAHDVGHWHDGHEYAGIYIGTDGVGIRYGRRR